MTRDVIWRRNLFRLQPYKFPRGPVTHLFAPNPLRRSLVLTTRSLGIHQFLQISRSYTPLRAILLPSSISYTFLPRNTRNPSPAPHSKELRFNIHTQPIQSVRVLKQSSASWTAALVVALFGCVVAHSLSPSQPQSEFSPLPKNLESRNIGSLNNMTGETLPGRPGNLTPQEEEKLKEFWTATLKVFGVVDTGKENANGSAELEKEDVKLDKKIKKKRFAAFRSKYKEDDATSIASTESGAPDEDKHGQTKEFHDAIASLSPETIRTAFWNMLKLDHPDGLLLRFLRARKWDVEKALIMMISTLKWRAVEMHVDDDIMLKGELGAIEAINSSDLAEKKLGEDFITQLRMGKSFLHGTEASGRPMCFVRVRLHKQGEQSQESLERFTIYTIETARLTLSPPVDTAVSNSKLLGKFIANLVAVYRL